MHRCMQFCRVRNNIHTTIGLLLFFRYLVVQTGCLFSKGFDDRIRFCMGVYYESFIYVCELRVYLLVDKFTFTLITPSYNGPALWCENVLRSHRSQQLRYLLYLL